MDKDAYYFPHFANARNDRKIRRLRKELGVEGYGIYFMVLEVLREQQQFKYPMDDIDLLADDFNTSDQKVRVVVCNYGLFDVDDDEQFFSPKFIEYMTPYLETKHRNRVNGIKGNLIKHGYAKKAQLDSMSDDEILHLNEIKSDLSGGESGGGRNKRKEKERKVNESKVNTRYPFDDFWDDYDKKKDRKKSEAKWKRINESDREKIKDFIPVYKRYEPNPDYRKNPTTFLNSEIWNDDWSAYPPKQERNNQNHGNNTARTKGDEHVEFLTRHMR